MQANEKNRKEFYCWYSKVPKALFCGAGLCIAIFFGVFTYACFTHGGITLIELQPLLLGLMFGGGTPMTIAGEILERRVARARRSAEEVQ